MVALRKSKFGAGPAATLLALLPTIVFAADWPQWRGPARTGHAPPTARAPARLNPDAQPRWKIAVGGGHSSPVVAEGKVLFLDVQDRQEVAHLLEASSGKEVWRAPYAEAFADEWGAGPRATPLIDDGRAYVQSCRGAFRCLSLADGRLLWGTRFEEDWGVRFVGGSGPEGAARRRGNNGSGVIAGDRLILPVGATNGANLVCFDKRTGRLLWQAGYDEAAYSSLMVATLAGVPQVLAFTGDALLGADLAAGTVLWRVPLRTDAKRHAVTPVVWGDLVIVSSWTFGQIAFRIRGGPAGLKAEGAWTNRASKINIATPVLVDGHLYSQGPNRDYVCLDAATGRLRWAQPGFAAQPRREYASTIAIGSRLLVLTEAGTLFLLEANPERYVEQGRAQACGNTWAHPAWADGRLFVRDGRSLACFDLASTD